MHTLGTLKIVPALEHADLLAKPVYEMLSHLDGADAVGVTEIDPNLSDTAAFCAEYSIDMSQAANCVILKSNRAEKEWYAACVVFGNTRADVNGLARRTLDARKVSFAAMEQAVAETSMEYGAITPIGLPADWPILVDKAVADSPLFIIGSGIRKSKLVVFGALLASLPNAQILEGLGRTIAAS